MIAAFLILRLRSVLGRHKDSGEPNQNNNRETFSADPSNKNNADPSNKNNNENVISIPKPEGAVDQESNQKDETILETGINKIQSATGDFDPPEFLKGAQAAFEIIVQAFAEGNTELLETLLNNDVYNNFLQAIRSREAEQQTLENNLIRIISAEIIEADKENNNANVTVKIVSEQVNVTRDHNGEIVDGDPDHVAMITDIWTFSRDIESKDPNWLLIATRSLD